MNREEIPMAQLSPEAFEEGREYPLWLLPDSDMNNSGKLEMVDNEGTLAAKYGEYYVELEWHSVKCTDITHEDEFR